MKILILLLGVMMFSIYFYGIGMGYWSFLPFVIFLILGGIMKNQYKQYMDISSVDNKYLFLGAWIFVNIAIFILFHFLGIGVVESILGILGINILILLLSYVVKLPYMNDITYITYFLGTVILRCYTLIIPGISSFLTLQYLFACSMGFLAFIYFIVPIYYPIAPYIKNHFVLLVIATVYSILYGRFSDKYIAILVLLGTLGIILGAIKYILDTNIQKPISKDISVRKILAGERILPEIRKREKNGITHNFTFFRELIAQLPEYAKYFLEALNMLLLGVFLRKYISTTSALVGELLFVHWAIILVFLGNIFLFKKIKYTSIFQKIGMFLGVNIFVYIVLFSFYSQVSDTLVFSGILWSIVYSIVIFNLGTLFPTIQWSTLDYITGLGIDIFLIAANSILIAYLPISGQLIFAFIFLYITIKTLIILYTINKIKNLPLGSEDKFSFVDDTTIMN